MENKDDSKKEKEKGKETIIKKTKPATKKPIDVINEVSKKVAKLYPETIPITKTLKERNPKEIIKSIKEDKYIINETTIVDLVAVIKDMDRRLFEMEAITHRFRIR